MHSIQRSSLLQGLTSVGISYRFVEGNNEISVVCPVCSPQHDNKRHTLFINASSNKWICFRCSPVIKGVSVSGRLLRLLRLEHLQRIFDDDEELPYVEDDTLDKVRRRLLFDEEDIHTEVSPLSLPKGYRTDWTDTIMGRKLHRYLRNRGLTVEQIHRHRIGYVVRGNYGGSIVLPVYMKKKLRFWQVRRVFLAGSNVAKYDSPTVERADILFNYDVISKNGEAVIVEGIFDAISQEPKPAVALLGKSISNEQIALLVKKRVRKVTVVLDGEAWNDTLAVAQAVREKLFGVRRVSALRLPEKLDPGKLGSKLMKKIVEHREFRP